MKGLQIFLHSVRQVTGNLGGALRISGILYLVQFLPWALFSYIFRNSTQGMSGIAFTSGLCMVLGIGLFATTWIAVAWHRHLLKGETPKIGVPKLVASQLGAYFQRLLLIGVLLFAAWSILGSFFLLVTTLFPLPAIHRLGSLSDVLLLYLSMAVFILVPLAFIGIRLAVTLPGAALGRELAFFTGWTATRSDWKAILVLSFILVAGFLIVVATGPLLPGSPAFAALVWQLLFGWLSVMFGLSILTTLYGHYIEGRPLV